VCIAAKSSSSDTDSLNMMRRIASKLRLQHKQSRVNSDAASTNETTGLLPVKVRGFRGFCNYHWSDFRNSVSQDGWDQLQGRYSVGPTGFRIKNDDYGGSRIRKAGWHFGPPNGEVSNYIKVVFRGAPDSGKNSYVCLREPRCQDDFSDNNCDEIDIVESYGSNQRAEAMSYRWTPGGQSRGTLYTLASSGTGSGFHTYELKQTPRDGRFTVAMDRRTRDFDNGPRNNLMMLYIGIWDCSRFCGPHVNHDTYMEIQSVYLQQCFP